MPKTIRMLGKFDCVAEILKKRFVKFKEKDVFFLFKYINIFYY